MIDNSNSKFVNKKKYNQYFTNDYISDLMVKNIDYLDKNLKCIKILDPGSGHGILGLKAVKYICKYLNVDCIYIDLYEIDPLLINKLNKNFEEVKKEILSEHIRFAIIPLWLSDEII